MTEEKNKQFWQLSADQISHQLKTNSKNGLTLNEAKKRLNQQKKQIKNRDSSIAKLFVSQFTSPITLILIVATIISMILGDALDGAIIIAIIVASGILGFFQEFQAHNTVKLLLKSVEVLTTVIRDGKEHRISISHVVPGDIIVVRSGDVIPADARIFFSDRLLIDESALTGESFPVEKNIDVINKGNLEVSDQINLVFKGTHVVNGLGKAIVFATDKQTEFGQISDSLKDDVKQNTFTDGTTKFGYMLVKIMLFLTITIFIINALLNRPIIDSLLFSLSLAVGLTPQMLPIIVTISLSAGAKFMARKKVIIKKLASIENLGSMTILCTDKTGTITTGNVKLSDSFDANGRSDASIRNLATLNANLQNNFSNPIDRAIIEGQVSDKTVKLLNDIPYDFNRQRSSVFVDNHGVYQLITKGSFDSILKICSHASIDGKIKPISEHKKEFIKLFEKYSKSGYRVIALATKDLKQSNVSLNDEIDMCFIGFLTFFDPIKPDAKTELIDLYQKGVELKIITGDNKLISQMIASQVGLDPNKIMTGQEIEALNSIQLRQAVRQIDIFASVNPIQKQQIVNAYHQNGECVGFMGDGINDSPAINVADVGISINTAASVAKDAASVVLLEKSLSVISDAVSLGRKTFANTLKYIRVTISANFGNMISMSVASIFLPFLPMLPRQILLLNFLSDLPVTTIAYDNVDNEQLTAPGKWNLKKIRKFMMVFGLVSSFFDIITFVFLINIVKADASTFQTSWFILSTITELFIIFSLRTTRFILKSKPVKYLIILGAITTLITLAVCYIPATASPLGLVQLPISTLLMLVAITLLYILINEIVKRLTRKKLMS